MRRIATDERESLTIEEKDRSPLMENGSSRWRMESGEHLHWRMGALNGEWESRSLCRGIAISLGLVGSSRLNFSRS